MKSTDCCLNLIKLTSVMFRHQQTSNGQNLYQVLISLVELQKLTYATKAERSPRAILCVHNQSFIFGLLCMKLFSSPRQCGHGSMFGMPFHALTIHLPETLCIVNGRSIIAEAAERHFYKLRSVHYNLNWFGFCWNVLICHVEGNSNWSLYAILYILL